MQRRLLGEMLIAAGAAPAEEVNRALSDQQHGREERLGELLLERNAVAPDALADALAEQAGLERISGEELLDGLFLEEDMPVRFMVEHRVALLAPPEEGAAAFTAAVDDPVDYETRDAVALRFGEETVFVVASRGDMDAALERIEEFAGTDVESITRDIDAEDFGFDGELDDASEDALRDMASEAPVIRLVNVLINRAVERRASDIHIELFEHDLKVRYRIDGVLHEAETLSRKYHAALVSRVKLLAQLNIAERRLPQDGHIKLRVRDREVELRIATTPTVYGENIVIRILDREQIEFDFARLGFPDDDLVRFKRVISQPHGLCLVTGPTGSGKTTTLYTALSFLNTTARKIITVEDPVEIRLAGINQIQVNPKVDLTFARGLRSIVRQDPDVIMVGEIRDLETAETAIHSALTGHMVFSTVHTNDAASTVARLLDMGVEAYLASSALAGILAQRLVRRLCEDCRRPTTVSGSELADFPGVDPDSTTEVYEATGCDVCEGTGFRGRIGLYEFMVVDDDIRSLVVRNAEASAIREHARANGMTTLREAGLRVVRDGVSTPEEVRAATLTDEVAV